MVVIGKPIPDDAYPVPVVTHTDEAREMLAAGIIKPGDPALDLPVDSMTDREILAEVLIHQRNTRDMVSNLVAAIAASPLGAMMNGKLGG